MGFAVRSQKPPFSFTLALGLVALSVSACAPRFNLTHLGEGSRGSSVTYQGEVLITSPDQDGTKISYLAESSVAVSGICSEPGWSVTVSGGASGTTTCQNDDTWSLSLNFSAASDGTLNISAAESNGSEQSEPTNRAFTKDTTFCAANSGGSPYAGGSGTAGDPYLICSTAQLMTLSNTAADWDDSFQLRNDIDLTAQTWTPVNFNGTTFDGDGFKVENLTVNLPTTDNIGFFSSAGGTVENLGIVNADVTGEAGIGILAGGSGASISNCYTTGTITGTEWHVGGMIGDLNGGSVLNSWSSAAVSGPDAGDGGLIAHNHGYPVSRCYATGSVTGGSNMGGLEGVNDVGSVVTDSYATGAVDGGTVGGLVGVNSASIVTSFARGAVSGSGTGGLSGSSTGTATDSYWDITTSGQATSADGAGLTDSEMQSQASFTGFDFTTPVWAWKSYFSGYPVLDWQ